MWGSWASELSGKTRKSTVEAAAPLRMSTYKIILLFATFPHIIRRKAEVVISSFTASTEGG